MSGRLKRQVTAMQARLSCLRPQHITAIKQEPVRLECDGNECNSPHPNTTESQYTKEKVRSNPLTK